MMTSSRGSRQQKSAKCNDEQICIFDDDLALLAATTYIAYKAPLPTPGILLVRSWAEKIEGRKMYIKGTMEDGFGNVYATAETLYIIIKPKL